MGKNTNVGKLIIGWELKVLEKSVMIIKFEFNTKKHKKQSLKNMKIKWNRNFNFPFDNSNQINNNVIKN